MILNWSEKRTGPPSLGPQLGLWIYLCCSLWWFPHRTQADLSKLNKAELKSRQTLLTSKATHRRLSKAHDLMSKGKEAQAIEILNRLLKRTEKRAYEKAQTMQALGFAHAQQEKYSKALEYLKGAIDLEKLPYAPTLSILYTMAQLLTAQENYGEALQKINLWLALADEPRPHVYILKATLYAQQENFKEALKLVTKALSMGQKAKESWLSLAVTLHYREKNFKKARSLLETLTARYPERKKYWKQLAGVYLHLEENPKALATMELAHKGQALEKTTEMINLVGLLIHGGNPLKAAQLLEKALKEGKVKRTQRNYEILGDAWVQAEEMDQALKAYALSAQKARKGGIFAKQGRLYLEQEKWEEAEKYLSQGLAKGGLNRPEHVHMALGVARFHLKKFEKAIKSFQSAQKISKKMAKQVHLWIRYVRAEQGPSSKNF